MDGQPTELRESAPPPADPWIGRIVDQRYRIEREIGEGGMGIVYLATHTTLQKRMAVKVLRGEMARDPDVVQRFIQEAQASSAIGHPNIIDIHDFGRLPDGSVYFVMEFLEGQSLTDLVTREGRVSLLDALAIAEMIASALSAAHRRGIVHRDLKPDNVFLVPRGTTQHFVKVLDFGIAKVGNATSKLTKTGMVFGTPHYMSPEQAAGQSVDARTDVYALGVILYEMCTGTVPFDADTFMGILTKHMFEPPPRRTDGLLGPLEPVIARALSKKPEQRYATMDEVLADLAAVRAGAAVKAAPALAPALPGMSTPTMVGHDMSSDPSSWSGRVAPIESPSRRPPQPRGSRKRRVVYGVVAGLLVAGGVAGGLVALAHRTARQGIEAGSAPVVNAPRVAPAAQRDASESPTPPAVPVDANRPSVAPPVAEAPAPAPTSAAVPSPTLAPTPSTPVAETAPAAASRPARTSTSRRPPRAESPETPTVTPSNPPPRRGPMEVIDPWGT